MAKDYITWDEFVKLRDTPTKPAPKHCPCCGSTGDYCGCIFSKGKCITIHPKDPLEALWDEMDEWEEHLEEMEREERIRQELSAQQEEFGPSLEYIRAEEY